jgi:hypothetical protein
MHSHVARWRAFVPVALIAHAIAAHAAPARAGDLPITPPPAEPVLKSPLPPASGSFWIGADYLLWSTKGARLPPLVTTSPPGTPKPQAGVVGAPGTTVLFGDGAVADGWRSGVRLRGGYWFEPRRRSGIEAEFFALGSRTQGLAASNPILALPFVDVTSGLPQSRLVAFPGQSVGSVAVSDSSRLLGAGIDYRHELCGTCWFGTISGLIGYRFVRLRDSLAINTTTTSTSAALPVPIGTVLTSADQFGTSNDFHGFHLGLTGDVVYGPWTLTWLGKLSLGDTLTSVEIGGSNTIAVPGLAPVTTPGGVYAQPTNIGSASTSHLSLLPELSADVSYRFTDHLRACAGYSLLYWTGVVRPGGAIDTVINPTQLDGNPLVGPARPQPLASLTDYWAQGFNIGLTYDFGVGFIAAVPSTPAAVQYSPKSFTIDPNNPAVARPSSFWISADYLLWSTKGDHLPPLVTASPPGTPPGTLVLFGDGEGNVASDWRSGVRLRSGYWFEPQRRSGFEAQFFLLGGGISGFAASDPNPAPPFFYISSGMPSATSVGSLAVGDSSSLRGAGIDYRHELCGTCALGPISGLVGYQFLRLHDTLGIDATTTAPFPTGTVVTFADQLGTSNNFHGFDLGLTGDVVWGPWTLTWLGKIALGDTFTSVEIGGSNTVAVPGLAPVTTPGGIYAQPANIGSTSSARLSLVPELSADVSYRLADHVRASAGYSLLYWTGVVRPGSGPARQQPLASPTDYWARGFNFGLTYDY